MGIETYLLRPDIDPDTTIYYLFFDVGISEIEVGNVVTNTAGTITATVAAIIVTSGSWATSDAAGMMLFTAAPSGGSFANNNNLYVSAVLKANAYGASASSTFNPDTFDSFSAESLINISDVAIVRFIKLGLPKLQKKVSHGYSNSEIANYKKIAVFMRKVYSGIILTGGYLIGNFDESDEDNNNGDESKWERALNYAIGEWPKLTAKYLTLFRWDTVNNKEFTGDYWWNGTTYVRPKLIIKDYAIYEDHNNNKVLESINLDSGDIT